MVGGLIDATMPALMCQDNVAEESTTCVDTPTPSHRGRRVVSASAHSSPGCSPRRMSLTRSSRDLACTAAWSGDLRSGICDKSWTSAFQAPKRGEWPIHGVHDFLKADCQERIDILNSELNQMHSRHALMRQKMYALTSDAWKSTAQEVPERNPQVLKTSEVWVAGTNAACQTKGIEASPCTTRSGSRASLLSESVRDASSQEVPVNDTGSI